MKRSSCLFALLLVLALLSSTACDTLELGIEGTATHSSGVAATEESFVTRPVTLPTTAATASALRPTPTSVLDGGHLSYSDPVLGLSLDIPLWWETQASPGAVARFYQQDHTGARLDVLTMSVLNPESNTLESALAEVTQGAWGPYIRDVRAEQLGTFQALHIDLGSGGDRPSVMWLVLAPSGRAVALVPNADPALIERMIKVVLNTLRPIDSALSVATPTPEALPVFTPSVINLPRSLYFLSAEPVFANPRGVWRLMPGDSAVERVTPPDLDIASFDVWLGDGRIALGTHDGQLYVVMPGHGPRLLYDASLQGADAFEIDSVAWSPAGTRLAYSIRYRSQSASPSGESPGELDGLWLLTIDDAAPVKLLSNRHPRRDGDQLDVSDLRIISDPVWSPDGSALMLTSHYWEWSDILWLDPVAPDAEEKNLHDPEGAWTNGSWADGGQSILLSGVDRACFSDLLRIARHSGGEERLVDGQLEGLAVFLTQELPTGIAFLTFRDCNAQQLQLYLGQQRADEFSYIPAGPSGGLCNSGYARDIEWDPTGRVAVLSCGQEARLIALDGTMDVDLTPYLGPLTSGNQLKVLWGEG